MTIKIKCRKCEAKFHVKDAAAGRRVECRECGVPIKVPLPRPDEEELLNFELLRMVVIRRAVTRQAGRNHYHVGERKKQRAANPVRARAGSGTLRTPCCGLSFLLRQPRSFFWR